MIERLTEKTSRLLQQFTGKVVVDKVAFTQRSFVVGGSRFVPGGIRLMTAETVSVTRTPHKKIGPFNTPFLNHAATETLDLTTEEGLAAFMEHPNKWGGLPEGSVAARAPEDVASLGTEALRHTIAEGGWQSGSPGPAMIPRILQ